MSISGTYSNRGDYFQMLVAMRWAIRVLDNPDYEWLTIDSTEYEVDDVVIGKTDNTLICCQCKKNQPNFKEWTISDLASEIEKAFNLYQKHSKINIRFCSRNPFGYFEKIKEYAMTQPNRDEYEKKLPENLKKTNELLSSRLNGSNPYPFLQRINFDVYRDNDETELDIKERLQHITTKAPEVYSALLERICKLSAREKNDITSLGTQKLSKKDIQQIVSLAGGMITPPLDTTKALNLLSSISHIGRSWNRDIGCKRLHRKIQDELIDAIRNKNHSILLSGGPGSGKTCVMLDLQERLEQCAEGNSNIVPLFIQTREFADLNTPEERAAHGLDDSWIQSVACLAESRQIVILIDSLDVLSISREYKTLTYFLAQIDRLRNISNITIVVACREFDRKYDARITNLKWNVEIKCGLFDWDNDVKPLLDGLHIDVKAIPADTRKIILNPRELALFVGLAQNKYNSKAVTSWDLAQEYIETVISKDSRLGDETVKKIEDISAKMLKERRLSITRQRLPFSDSERHILCSLNVIVETERGNFTFGHQTLFDVFVIWKAIRDGMTLNDFIKSLTPVPFVRPCIRSFLDYLFSQERVEYRKQIRVVLTGDLPFHIKRLVAESFADQIPADDDWTLIRDLHNAHKEIFQLIYLNSNRPEWFDFWNLHLLPIFFEDQNSSALLIHVELVFRWIQTKADEIICFCEKLLSCSFIDNEIFASKLAWLLNSIPQEKLFAATSLVDFLLNTHHSKHSFVGHILARSISVGAIEAVKLWQYITQDIQQEDLLSYKLNNKLHCKSYEFDSKENDFLSAQLMQYPDLLERVICDVEHWSQVRTDALYKSRLSFQEHFLHETSFDDIHSKSDIQCSPDGLESLLHALEDAIKNHAQRHSSWWEKNAMRICFSHEGGLRYIGIKSVTLFPDKNLLLVAAILQDKENYMSSLSYEIGQLIEKSFIFLAEQDQDTIINIILSLYQNEENHQWITDFRARMGKHIPCHLRSQAIQKLIDDYECKNGEIIRGLFPMPQGGLVRPPFEYTVFLSVRSENILKLLHHYTGYERTIDDFLIGGEEEVAAELREASGRHPTRLLEFLEIYFEDIAPVFRDAILSGISFYFSVMFGNMQKESEWEAIEHPNPIALTNRIMDEMEKHREYWHHNYSASSILEACSNVVEDPVIASRMTALCIYFIDYQEKQCADDTDLMTTAINTRSGNIASASMILINNLLKKNMAIPNDLQKIITKYTEGSYKPCKALILQRLPYTQYKDSLFGWKIFYTIMREDTDGLWRIAEPCLYHSYKKHFDTVKPILDRIYNEAKGTESECWGRIAALASLDGLLVSQTLYSQLELKRDLNAWHGAAQVWTNYENLISCREQCIDGIQVGLKQDIDIARTVANEITKIFSTDTLVTLPTEILTQYFHIITNNSENNDLLSFRIGGWLKQHAERNPQYALKIAEMYSEYEKNRKNDIYDHKNNFTQLLTLLFKDAEELEQTDNGKMLLCVVELQDFFLSKGVSQMKDWLKDAERP